eukprot:2824033-Pyramimonas_sp.AAC.1
MVCERDAAPGALAAGWQQQVLQALGWTTRARPLLPARVKEFTVKTLKYGTVWIREGLDVPYVLPRGASFLIQRSLFQQPDCMSMLKSLPRQKGRRHGDAQTEETMGRH